MGLLESVDARNSEKEVPDFKPGDTVKVQVRVVEGEKERLQAFQGIVIQRKGQGARETFTVRRVTGESASSASSRCVRRMCPASRSCGAAGPAGPDSST